MSDWLPIETAPEDETILIAATPDWVGTAYWVLDEDHNRWHWEWANGGGPVHQRIVPTHWMPLPEFPK